MSEPVHQPLTAEEEAELRENLKRCSPETIDAAITYRKTGDLEQVPTIIIGIIARFCEPDVRPKLENPSDDLTILDDLGIDSLTMMEIVVAVEETLGMRIENEELQNLRTLGDVKGFVAAKARGEEPPAPAKSFSSFEIGEALPHAEPFLFLNEASIEGKVAKGKYRITGDEPFLAGHFPSNPTFPASLMIEALGQLGVFLLLRGELPDIGRPVDPGSIYFISTDGVRCSRRCVPGDVLEMEMRFKNARHPLASFDGSIMVNGEKTAFAEGVSLTFDYDNEG
ncbi:MAG: phosphopantetheine-binding protein [Opitutales bacterium]